METAFRFRLSRLARYGSTFLFEIKDQKATERRGPTLIDPVYLILAGFIF